MRILTAPNAKAANKMLPENEAIIRQGPGKWAFTVSGQVYTSGGSFQDALAAAAICQLATLLKSLD